MNKWSVLVLLFIGSIGFLFGTSANTVVTNDVTMTGSFASISTNVSVTVGPIYGFGPVFTANGVYSSPNNYDLKIPVSITNGGNDADSNAQVFVEFISNESGYSGTNWNCHIELAGTNAGTNYAIPLANFGEGAVFMFNLVVSVPANVGTNTNVMGFVNVHAATSSNAGHVVAFYTGLNGVSYGGSSNVSKQIEVDVNSPNAVLGLTAADGIDTIGVFDGSKGLRRTAQTISVNFATAPLDINSAYVWFDVDNIADGPGGANPNDKMIKMKSIGGYSFSALIDESYLGTGNIVSFLVQLDSFNYAYGSTYKMINLVNQDKYETILMHNVINRGSGELAYIKMPAKTLGTAGKVLIYSISGDLVMTILDGNLAQQIISWDGNDKAGKLTAKGLYFIVFDFNNLKEVRKLFVK